MKKLFNPILLVVITGSISAYYFWQNYKQQIVKGLISNSVNTLTDSLYLLQYDSAMIDEINGEVYFENILLKPDPLQLQSLKLANHLPSVLIEISIKSISVQGLDIDLAIDKKQLIAQEIIINEPHITINSTGDNKLQKEDSISLCRKILGNYKCIHTESIEIRNVQFISKKLGEEVNMQLKNLNILFYDITVDSTKDYRNVVCYFINNMKANATQLYIKQPNRNRAFIFDNIKYNAIERNIFIDKLYTLRDDKNEEEFEINKLKFQDLNIVDFVNKNTINVGNISTDAG